MRIVLLTGSEVQHRYVAQCLARLPNLVGIVVTEQPSILFSKRLRRAIKRFGIGGLVSRALLKIALKISGETSRRKAELERVLGDAEFPDNIPLLRTVGVNSIATQKVLRDLAPDVLCVYGTYLVSNATLSISKQAALNLHTGISPRYRGADCEFWPLYNCEPQFIGATVHVCTADVDGGAIYGTANATLQTDDGLGALFGRSVIAGGAIYRDILERLSRGILIDITSQDLSMGTEYRVAMRGWRAEFRVARLLREGLIRDYLTAQRSN